VRLHTGFAEGVEVGLKSKVDAVSFVIRDATALRLLLVLRKVGAREVGEFFRRAKLAADSSVRNVTSRAATNQTRLAE
jgi:hypothetical protein